MIARNKTIYFRRYIDIGGFTLQARRISPQWLSELRRRCEQSLTSCVLDRFPDGFPHNVWTAWSATPAVFRSWHPTGKNALLSVWTDWKEANTYGCYVVRRGMSLTLGGWVGGARKASTL